MADNFTIKADDRRKHVYIPGQTQFGKTTLMYWMVLQHIMIGHGVCFIDGKGDAMKKFFLRLIPDKLIPSAVTKIEKRIENGDIILLDVDTPVPLDFMACHPEREREKEKLVSDLKFILSKGIDISHAYSVNTNLSNIIYTLLNFNENKEVKPERKATFLDIDYFLEDETRRKEIKLGLTDRDLINLWKQEIPRPNFNAQDIGRITGRMNDFIRSQTLKKIFGDPQPRLNILRAMQERKVILVNVGPGDEIQKLYGTLLLSKIRQAAFQRAELSTERPENYYLFCDEFQEYQTSDFSKMIAQAGGLGLCLTLANQWMGQLEAPVLNAIRTVSTFIIFRIDPRDASTMKDYFPAPSPPPPLTPVDKKREQLVSQIQRYRIELDILEKRKAAGIKHLDDRLAPSGRFIGKFGDFGYYDSVNNEYDPLILKMQQNLANALVDLQHLPPASVPNTDESPMALSDIQQLQPGEAIYRAADTSVRKIRTPEPPRFSRDYAESIRKRTLENYAGQIPPMRDTDSSAVNIHDEPPELTKFDKPPPTKK